MKRTDEADARSEIRQFVADLTPNQRFAVLYWDDPVGFARDCVAWADGEGLAPYQEAILASLAGNKRESARGPHGLGKTAVAALAIWWFILTREGLARDWKIPTTASSWHQLEAYLWPEIHKWARRIRWDNVGRSAPQLDYELLRLNVKLKHGAASAMASRDAELIEGAHADQMLFVFDEAKAIPALTFDAAEGAFSTGDVYALAISTPGDPAGRFYEIQSRRPGYEDWHVTHVTLQEALAAHRVSLKWVDQRRLQWGEDSSVFQNRVLGQFASAAEDAVIPLTWVEAANERWLSTAGGVGLPFSCVGVDVARSGSDHTVLALRRQNTISELREPTSKQDTMETTGLVSGILNANGGYASVDVIGIGAGVVDRLRELQLPVLAFNASEGTTLLDSSGELGFVNKRSAAWWTMRELLDPANGGTIALPPDDMLTGDLTAPKWKVTSGGRIQVESKDEIRKRIGRSTDHGDAVIQAFWSEPAPLEDYVYVYDAADSISPV